MTFVAFLRLLVYNGCSITTFVAYDVCRIMTFVAF